MNLSNSTNNVLKPKSTSITNDYNVGSKVLGLGISGKVVECFSKNGQKYALKVKWFCYCTGKVSCIFSYIRFYVILQKPEEKLSFIGEQVVTAILSTWLMYMKICRAIPSVWWLLWNGNLWSLNIVWSSDLNYIKTISAVWKVVSCFSVFKTVLMEHSLKEVRCIFHLL